MESTNVESQESLLHDQTQTSSKLKQEASLPKTPFPTGSERPYRDSIFTFLFLTAILTTFTFGIIASTQTDTLNMDTKLRLSRFNPTTNTCEITQQQTPKDSDSDPDFDFAFVTLAAITSLSALVLTIPLSLLLVSLLRRYTRPLLLISAPFMSLLYLGLGLLWFLLVGLLCLWYSEVCATVHVSTHITFALCLPGLSAFFAYSLWKNWTGSAVENAVEVLRMATGFWKEHFVLLVVNPLLLMGAMVVVNGPIFMFMWFVFNVGEIVPNFDVVNDPIKGCELATGSPCCRAERPGWVYAYITFASFTTFWVLMVSMVLQHLVVSGTVSLWYFAPTGSSAIGNIKRSLRNAYGPSFGTTCNLGTIVTILVELVRPLKKISVRVLKSNHQGMMHNIFQRCFSRMSQFPECDTKLASTFASISGLSLWESSKESHYLLLQNSPISTARINFHYLILDALMGLLFMCTLLQTLLVYGVLEYFTNAFFWKKFLITLLCFPIIMIGLGTGFSEAISSVITTVAVCCAIERNVGEISKPEVCHVFMITATSLPENGAKPLQGA